jgi:hypothetical protein
MTTKNELVPVPFHGDAILATKTDDGRILVAVSRVCESLGIDAQSQRKRLTKSSWARLDMIHSLDTRGHRQATYVIDLDRLPMWLSTINVNKVAAPVRQKLVIYQNEAATVLARHFLGGEPPAQPQPTPTPPPVPSSPLAAMMAGLSQTVAVLNEIVGRQEEQSRQIQEVRETAATKTELADAFTRAAAAETKADAAMGAASGHSGYMTLLGYARTHGISLPEERSSAIGKELTAECKAAGVPLGKLPHQRWGHVNAYPEAMIAPYFSKQAARETRRFPALAR